MAKKQTFADKAKIQAAKAARPVQVVWYDDSSDNLKLKKKTYKITKDNEKEILG
jgi:hypothetical protein